MSNLQVPRDSKYNKKSLNEGRNQSGNTKKAQVPKITLNNQTDNSSEKIQDKKTKHFILQKIYHNIFNKMNKVKVSNTDLMKHIESQLKIRERKEYLGKLDFINDNNPYSLKFLAFLQVEEIERIIKNIDKMGDGSKGFDEKLQKRDDVISYLFKEKVLQSKFVSKMMEIFEFTGKACSHMKTKISKIDSFDGKDEVLKNLEELNHDLSYLDTFKSFFSSYFTYQDYENFNLAQYNVNEHKEAEKYKKFIENISTSFERCQSHEELRKKHDTLQHDLESKTKNYDTLLKRYENLIEDFILYTKKGVIKEIKLGGVSGNKIEQVKKAQGEIESKIRQNHNVDGPIEMFEHQQDNLKMENNHLIKNQLKSKVTLEAEIPKKKANIEVEIPKKTLVVNKPKKMENTIVSRMPSKITTKDKISVMPKASNQKQKDDYVSSEELKNEFEAMRKAYKLTNPQKQNSKLGANTKNTGKKSNDTVNFDNMAIPSNKTDTASPTRVIGCTKRAEEKPFLVMEGPMLENYDDEILDQNDHTYSSSSFNDHEEGMVHDKPKIEFFFENLGNFIGKNPVFKIETPQPGARDPLKLEFTPQPGARDPIKLDLKDYQEDSDLVLDTKGNLESISGDKLEQESEESPSKLLIGENSNSQDFDQDLDLSTDDLKMDKNLTDKTKNEKFTDNVSNFLFTPAIIEEKSEFDTKQTNSINLKPESNKLSEFSLDLLPTNQSKVTKNEKNTNKKTSEQKKQQQPDELQKLSSHESNNSKLTLDNKIQEIDLKLGDFSNTKPDGKKELEKSKPMTSSQINNQMKNSKLSEKTNIESSQLKKEPIQKKDTNKEKLAMADKVSNQNTLIESKVSSLLKDEPANNPNVKKPSFYNNIDLLRHAFGKPKTVVGTKSLANSDVPNILTSNLTTEPEKNIPDNKNKLKNTEKLQKSDINPGNSSPPMAQTLNLDDDIDLHAGSELKDNKLKFDQNKDKKLQTKKTLEEKAIIEEDHFDLNISTKQSKNKSTDGNFVVDQEPLELKLSTGQTQNNDEFNLDQSLKFDIGDVDKQPEKNLQIDDDEFGLGLSYNNDIGNNYLYLGEPPKNPGKKAKVYNNEFDLNLSTNKNTDNNDLNFDNGSKFDLGNPPKNPGKKVMGNNNEFDQNLSTNKDVSSNDLNFENSLKLDSVSPQKKSGKKAKIDDDEFNLDLSTKNNIGSVDFEPDQNLKFDLSNKQKNTEQSENKNQIDDSDSQAQ